MPHNSDKTIPVTEWFCVHAQPKQEHIAAAHLRRLSDVEVFLPRIRCKRATRRGAAWFTEALFPGYLFTRFPWPTMLRAVGGARGVRGIVHFGDRWPAIDDATIADLRASFGAEEIYTVSDALSPGDTVMIIEGGLRGQIAVVAQIRSGRGRVAVLMEFLGRQSTVEVSASTIVREGNARAKII